MRKNLSDDWQRYLEEEEESPAFASEAILAQEPFPVRTCTVFFPFTSVSGSVLSMCLQPSFVVSHLFSRHVLATERMCQFLRYVPPLRIWVLLTVLFQILKDQDFAQVRWRRKSMKSTYCYRSLCKTRLGSKIASELLLRHWPSRLPRWPKK